MKTKSIKNIIQQTQKVSIELIFDHLPPPPEKTATRKNGDAGIRGSEKVVCCNDRKNAYYHFLKRNLKLSSDTDIADLLPKFAAKGLAVWQDDKRGGVVNGNGTRTILPTILICISLLDR